MKKRKVIAGKNFSWKFSIVHVAVYWFLWDKIPTEWGKTLLCVFVALHIFFFVLDLFTTDRVDIFEPKK